MVNNRDANATAVAKRRNQYFGEVFAFREQPNAAKERASRESFLIAEVKTNVIVSRPIQYPSFMLVGE